MQPLSITAFTATWIEPALPVTARPLDPARVISTDPADGQRLFSGPFHVPPSAGSGTGDTFTVPKSVAATDCASRSPFNSSATQW